MNLASLLTMIAEAREAQHALRTGRAVVEVVDQNGERVRYSVANRADLAAYIQDLQSQIDALQGKAASNGPMRIWGGR